MKVDTAITFGWGIGLFVFGVMLTAALVISFAPIPWAPLSVPSGDPRPDLVGWGFGCLLACVAFGIGSGCVVGSLAYYFTNRPAKLCPKCKNAT